MKKKIISVALALLMLAAALPFTATPALASTAPTKTSFDVKHEMAISDGSKLLFSEKPLQSLTIQDLSGVGVITANSFPLGTKIANEKNGSLTPIGAVGMTALREKPLREENIVIYGGPAYEITLTAAMTKDENGISIYRTISMNSMITELGLTTVFVGEVSVEEAPVKTSFGVKYEITIGYGDKLLFSEIPTQILNGPQYFGMNVAYVFPIGSKIAEMKDGSLVQIYAVGETSIMESNLKQYGSAGYELVLTAEMAADKNGIRIGSSYAGRGLLTVFAGESPTATAPKKPSFEVKAEIETFDGG